MAGQKVATLDHDRESFRRSDDAGEHAQALVEAATVRLLSFEENVLETGFEKLDGAWMRAPSMPDFFPWGDR